MKFSPRGSPVPLVFVGLVLLEILMGSPERGRQTSVGWENQPFVDLSVNISKTVADNGQSTINDY